MTEAAILNALSNVQEPDLGKDLVTLNMVKDIQIKDNDVSFTIVLTTPACPMKDMMRTASENAVKLLVNKEAKVTVNFTSNTSTTRKDNQQVLSGVKNIIAVVSGKGGVGKSTVSANLALALAEGGASVGLMDADIYGPSVPIMFGVRGERPLMKEVNGKGMIVPLEKFGIKLMSIGLLVDEKNAVVWRGPMASSAIRQFVTDVDWGELDYLVIDMPPGTGDIHLTLMQTVPVTGVVIVTTPQNVALADAKKALLCLVRPRSMCRLSDSLKIWPILHLLNYPIINIISSVKTAVKTWQKNMTCLSWVRCHWYRISEKVVIWVFRRWQVLMSRAKPHCVSLQQMQ